MREKKKMTGIKTFHLSDDKIPVNNLHKVMLKKTVRPISHVQIFKLNPSQYVIVGDSSISGKQTSINVVDRIEIDEVFYFLNFNKKCFV